MKNLLQQHKIIFSAIGLFLVLSFFTIREDEEISQLSGYTMGTTFQLQFVDHARNFSRVQIQGDIQELLRRMDQQLFSTYSPGSELSLFNQAPIDALFVVSSEFIAVTELAQEISVLTDGAFDVTVGPLVNLWGFGPEPNDPSRPNSAAIEAAKQTVGYQHLTINGAASWVSKDTSIYVDLSAIAKGYAVDRVAIYFDSVGIADYFLEIGGEIKLKGYKPGNQTWVPAVERPVDTAPQIHETLNSRGEELAIAGSGDYRNYFEEDGKRYSHEIDPRTGMPIDHNLAAVYVIDRSAARADALATAFMVLGYEQGMELATTLEQAVYFIVSTDDGQFMSYYTDQFMPYIDRTSSNE